MSRLFGTDGVRGVANKELTPDLAFRLGYAGAKVLAGETIHKPLIIVGCDTRISCAMLESAIVSGIMSAGADAAIVGVIPSPGIAYLTAKYKADAGVVISASHNSYEYNGIKFFSSNGYKLLDAIEDQIQKIVEGYDIVENLRPIGSQVGLRLEKKNAAHDYAEHLKRRMGVDLSGMRIALDCANGASSTIAPQLFRDLGADVVAIGVEPDGLNINKNCGSTYLERLRQTVLREACDLGLAFDGDADRMLALDEDGVEIDGDIILAIVAADMKRMGELKDNTLVVTVMSNMGLDIMCAEHGIKLKKTKVGDRYVLEEMLLGGYTLGGEQSGHIILLEKGTTGDGMMSGLRLLKALVGTKKRLNEARKIMRHLPQVLQNVRIPSEQKSQVLCDQDVLKAVQEVKLDLGDKGRVLLRPSGTEPNIRIMLEGENKEVISAHCARLVKLISERYGL